LQALAVREGGRCLAELAAASPADAPLADQVAAGFAASLKIAREHPLLNRLARHEPDAVLEALVANDSAVFRMARAFVAARIAAAPDGPKAGARADAAAEILIRLMFSFVLIQDTSLPIEDESRARELAARLLAPIAAG
jgi:hypothetical protein